MVQGYLTNSIVQCFHKETIRSMSYIRFYCLPRRDQKRCLAFRRDMCLPSLPFVLNLVTSVLSSTIVLPPPSTRTTSSPRPPWKNLLHHMGDFLRHHGYSYHLKFSLCYCLFSDHLYLRRYISRVDCFVKDLLVSSRHSWLLSF